MRRIGGDLWYSPSDLTEFMESRFASFMSRLAVDRPELVPARETDLTSKETILEPDEILARMGDVHEGEVLHRLVADGADVARIPDTRGAEAEARAATREAMRGGREYVFQAYLESPPFAGRADFLRRVEIPSPLLGAWSYEVWDAKLARRAKPYFTIQLCAYADMLGTFQHLRPDRIGVVLGTGEWLPFRCDDFFWLYRSLRDAFLGFVANFDPDDPPLPEKGADHRRWQTAADEHLRARDHVSRVANITRQQVRRLAGAGVETLCSLAGSPPASVPRIAPPVLERLVEQARLQRDSAGRDRPLYRALPPEPDAPPAGLALLPPPSPLDVFFDLEGFPLGDEPLEYLWGAASRPAGSPGGRLAYRDWWAHDAAAEQRALEGFLDWVAALREKDSHLHVYHYGVYEIVALKRLVGRCGSREDALDTLLREHVFVDLHAVVRNGVRVGEPRYSIKNLERLYMEARSADVASGGESIAWYEAWRARDESPDWSASPLLEQIRDYNEEDCVSTGLLADWLRERQRDVDATFVSPAGEQDEADEKRGAVREDDRERRELALELLAEIPEDPESRADGAEGWRVQALLAHLVEFHRRELRPTYWMLYHRCDLDPDERADDLDCLASLERTEEPAFPLKQSLGYAYRFDPGQLTKLAPGDTCWVAQQPGIGVRLEELDIEAGRAVLKLSGRTLAKFDRGVLPERLCLVHYDFVAPGPLPRAIADVARRWRDENRHLPPAIADFLHRRPPSLGVHCDDALVRPGEPAGDALVRLVCDLDDSSLCIQGPPGSGKTRSAAEAILALLSSGRRVGVSSHSHAAILNLLRACARASDGALRCLKVGGPEDDELYELCDGALRVADRARAVRQLSSYPLVGATAWAFAHDDFAEQFDTLFVDEAGQVSVANLVAMSRSARNLVLVGDPMQLSQPTQGTHPGDSGLSILDYFIGSSSTVPPHLGVFLDRTYRLHPEICRFVSGATYEGRLEPAPGNEQRVVRVPSVGGKHVTKEAGIVYLPIDHEGNRQSSDEEVALIRDVVKELLERAFVPGKGAEPRPLALDDLLFVAPYNHQVHRLKSALGRDAKVGTVDRFQGQQAPVVIVSLSASDAECAPRGIEFLLDRNRINVAVSRAQSLAIVVGSPKLTQTACSTIGQMERVNVLCRLAAEGAPDDGDRRSLP